MYHFNSTDSPVAVGAPATWVVSISEQIAYARWLAEAATPVADVCRQMGIAEAAFCVGRKKCAQLDVAELRQLRQLTEANARLKRPVADSTPDSEILQERFNRRLGGDVQARGRSSDP